jgi:hypothetical protein
VNALALRSALLAEGGTLAATLRPEPDVRDAHAGGTAGARGPRTAGREVEYELLLAMIREGSELHYGEPSVVDTQDPDLALLLGDHLYALGLSRLARLGDLAAVAELGDAISLIAQARAGGRPDLAEAVWKAGVIAICHGPNEGLEGAKELARMGDSRATQALLEASATGT